jgi:hypothetical protein
VVPGTPAAPNATPAGLGHMTKALTKIAPGGRLNISLGFVFYSQFSSLRYTSRGHAPAKVRLSAVDGFSSCWEAYLQQ